MARRSGYMTDNLARATAQPAYRPDQQTRPERKRRTATQSAPVIGIRKSMGFFACAVMLASLCVILYNAVLFANVRAKTNELDREISALNNEYANLYRTNDEAEQAIASSVDINRVYEVAVGQYGMVYPKDNEIIVFEMPILFKTLIEPLTIELETSTSSSCLLRKYCQASEPLPPNIVTTDKNPKIFLSIFITSPHHFYFISIFCVLNNVNCALAISSSF